MSQRGRGGGGDADDIAPAGGRAVLTVPTTIPSAVRTLAGWLLPLFDRHMTPGAGSVPD